MATLLLVSTPPSGCFVTLECRARDAWHAEPSRCGMVSARPPAADFEVRIALRRRRRGTPDRAPRQTSRVRPIVVRDGEGFTRGDRSRVHGRDVPPPRTGERVLRDHGAVLSGKRGRHATQRHAARRVYLGEKEKRG